MLTFHSGTASAVGWSVAGKSMCLRSVGSVLVMELMKEPSKGTGCTFWQLVGGQEPWDLLQVEPGPAAVGGRCWGRLLLRPLRWPLCPAAGRGGGSAKEPCEGLGRARRWAVKGRRLGEGDLQD